MSVIKPTFVRLHSGRIVQNNELTTIHLSNGKQYEISDLTRPVRDIPATTFKISTQRYNAYTGSRYTDAERIWIHTNSKELIAKRYKLTEGQANSLKYNSGQYLKTNNIQY